MSNSMTANMEVLDHHFASPPAKGVFRWRFWALFATLCLPNLFFAFEMTIISTSLPYITAQLDAGDNYVWFLNAYTLTSTAFVPFFGQIADLFGRRYPMMLSTSAYVLGSGISGGSTSAGMLIVGRLIQGLGGAGITTLSFIIVSDLVTVRETGKYNGILLATVGVGVAVGPVLGGIIADSGSWRWVFWLNLPLGGATLILQFLFIHVPYKRVGDQSYLRGLDWIGNALLLSAMVAILLALSWADTRYPWDSWRILSPFILGLLIMVSFVFFEGSRFCTSPMLPRRLFANRTAVVLLINTGFMSTIIFWRIMFLPLYFQSVLLASPKRAGILLLPTVLTAIPAAMLAGFALSRWGRYRAIHFCGAALVLCTTGLYITFDVQTTLVEIVALQIVGGFGSGILVTTYLPVLQGVLPEADMASATAIWAYLRSLGNIWGIAIPAAIFNHRFEQLVGSVAEKTVREAVSGGNAYAHVSSVYILSLPERTRVELVAAYRGTMVTLWEVCCAFCGLVLLLGLFERHVTLRNTK
ncbi:hypothetical protein NLG97_g6514 [Lecanicillium saksenae]|uniref:Uncharacterized protein n=1 Tax=Lecanicillium saksenae TaxID=468837 RepID=A0ACC1QSJ4_9HYPO|nr:hypothetical protein NLG97_g6514 [Lecanicillium saksenae]